MQEKQDKELGFAHGDLIKFNRWGWSNLNASFRFRCGPVPHITNGSFQKGTYYRYPRYIRVRRWNLAHREFGFIIPKKGRDYIPDPWDDFPRERHQSWKEYRKTQYKP